MQWIARLVCFGVALAGAKARAQSDIQQQVSSTAVQQRADLKDVKVVQNPGSQLPLTATFTDQNGKQVSLGSILQDRPLVLVPIFFRCKGVCELEQQGLLNAFIQDKSLVPGTNVDVATLSIDPQEKWDLAKQKMAETMEEYGKPKTASGWHFLCGDMANIRAVTDALGFSFTYDAEHDVVNHPSCIAAITPQGKVSTYMLTGMYQPAALLRDVNLAAKQGISPKSEELFFGCIHVDPISGKRSLMIQGVMRLLGFATVAALLIGIVSMAKKNRSGSLRMG